MSDVTSGEADDFFRKRRQILSEIDGEIRRRFNAPISVLFTDIEGSTRYFDVYGDIEGRQLIQSHNDLLFPVIGDHNGVIIKTIGDAIMARFDKSDDAVGCAIECQIALRKRNETVSDDRKLFVRMGLDYGDVVVDEKDVFGNIVNTASRIEALAAGGEILISERLHESLKASYDTVCIGRSLLKGKRDPLDLYLVNWSSRDEDAIKREWIGRQSHEEPEGVAIQIEKNSIELSPVNINEEAIQVGSLTGNGNPYLSRVMIHHPDLFFGRKRIISRTMRRLSADIPQSVSIVGERRIGKSSLLNHLRNPRTRREYLANPEQYYFVLVDFQGLRSQGTEACFTFILSEIQKQLSTYLRFRGPDGYEGLRAVCEEMSSREYRLVLLFDEFEAITRNEQLEPGFFALLRSLANNYAVAFVTATGARLHDICHTQDVADSPFFNIFTSQQLALFTQAEAIELISNLSANRGIPLAPLQDRIIESAGVHPFFLQMSCSAWYEYLEETGDEASSYVEVETPFEVEDMLLEEACGHYEYILRSISEDERNGLFRASEGNTIDLSCSASRALVRKGYLIQQGGRVVPFCRSFEAYIGGFRRGVT